MGTLVVAAGMDGTQGTMRRGWQSASKDKVSTVHWHVMSLGKRLASSEERLRIKKESKNQE